MKRLNRIVTLAHRWLGVGLCLLLALWFVSGAIMIFVPFPRLAPGDRLAGAMPVDMRTIAVAPAAAVAASGVAEPGRIRLRMGPDGPRYLIEPEKGVAVAVGAVDGRILPFLRVDEAAAAAAAFAGRPAGRVTGPFDHDLWVVHQRYDSRRPYFRVEIEDGRGTEVYVSARTAEVTQRTDRHSRLWNYAGSVSHWLYVVPLRKHPILWGDLLWWVSWAGFAATLSGVVVGVWRSAKALRIPRRSSLSVYLGVRRWHHLFGLGAGLVALTWMFSGLLSVDRGRIFPSGHPHPRDVAEFRGLSLAAAADRLPLGALGQLPALAEVEIVALAGRAWVIGRHADASRQAVMPADGPYASPAALFPDSVLAEASAAAWPGHPLVSLEPVAQGDFYSDLAAVSRTWTGTIRRAILADGRTWVHLDAADGRIVSVMGPERRLQRWLYNGLHTFDLPGLRSNQALRISTELLFLLAGLIVSLTGLILGARRVKLWARWTRRDP